MNGLDIALILIIVTTVAAGFMRGFLRQGAELAILYVAVVLSAQYHLVIGQWLGWFFAADAAALAGVGFLIMFFWSFLFAAWVVRRVFPQMRIAALGIFDNILGAGAGVATGVIAVCIITAVIMFAGSEPWVGYDNVRQSLSQSTETSMIVPYVSHYSPVLFDAVTPWFPGGVPAIFAPFVR